METRVTPQHVCVSRCICIVICMHANFRVVMWSTFCRPTSLIIRLQNPIPSKIQGKCYSNKTYHQTTIFVTKCWVDNRSAFALFLAPNVNQLSTQWCQVQLSTFLCAPPQTSEELKPETVEIHYCYSVPEHHSPNTANTQKQNPIFDVGNDSPPLIWSGSCYICCPLDSSNQGFRPFNNRTPNWASKLGHNIRKKVNSWQTKSWQTKSWQATSWQATMQMKTVAIDDRAA